MLGIVGILPYENLPVIVEKPFLINDDSLIIGNYKFPVERGTAALIASTIKVLEYFNKNKLLAFLVGDIGNGKGSRNLYNFLHEFLSNDYLDSIEVFIFHYILPDIDGCIKVLLSLEKLRKKPFLIADAGFMYVVKMVGYSTFFDLFTPDIGELAFLADEKAPHPFYTRGFLLEKEDQVEELIEKAYIHKNLPRYVLVKAKVDRVVQEGKILSYIDEPCVPVLEAIGGTGDTLTGIVGALIYCGYSPDQACKIGAKVNRLAGLLSNPTPATQIYEIIKYIPKAIDLLDL